MYLVIDLTPRTISNVWRRADYSESWSGEESSLNEMDSTSTTEPLPLHPAEGEISLSDDDVEDSFNSEMSSDFGDIFQYEHDVSQDVRRCSTPIETPILQDRRIFRAAMNDSICLIKGEAGPNVSWVESHLEFDSDNEQPYHVEGYYRYPTRHSESFPLSIICSDVE